MNWMGILLVAPIWGIVSSQLFLMALLALCGFVIGTIGVFAGKVARSVNAIAIGVNLFSIGTWGALLYFGDWFVAGVLRCGFSVTEKSVYWSFVGLSALRTVAEFRAKLRKIWSNSMDPGSFEDDIDLRKMGIDPLTRYR